MKAHKAKMARSQKKRESYPSELRLAKYIAKNIHNQKLRISDKQNENKLQSCIHK